MLLFGKLRIAEKSEGPSMLVKCFVFAKNQKGPFGSKKLDRKPHISRREFSLPSTFASIKCFGLAHVRAHAHLIPIHLHPR